MPFTFESDMIPIIKTNVKQLFDNKLDTMAFAQELPVNHRIVDLAFASMNMDYLRIIDNNVLKRAFRKLNMVQLDVLSIFFEFGGKVSIQRLSKLLRLPSDKVKELYLNKFMELELINQISRYSYCATSWVDINPSYVIAVEAKLSKWNEALQQALDNLNFADYSYVALDQEYCKRNVIERFKLFNIGLISVSENGTTTILNEPTKNTQYKTYDFRLQRVRLCRDLICQNSKWSIVENVNLEV